MSICACNSATVPDDPAQYIEAFLHLRDRCPALSLVTVPDDLLVSHQAVLSAPPDDAYHSSVPFLAFRNGYLSAFTAPIHRYILHHHEFHVLVTNQYRQDLQERWLLNNDVDARFKSARRYLSRLAELHFATWLEDHGWTLTNLEAYGSSFDVEAKAELTASFEIKYLAQREVVLELVRSSFGESRPDSLGCYSPVDYLLFRIYEAARQLQSSSYPRIAVAVLSDFDLSFSIPLRDDWIDWRNPSFLRRDTEVESFLMERYAENPRLDSDLRSALAGLNEIWFFKYADPFRVELAKRVVLR